MTKQKGSFSFDVPLHLDEKWMMGVTSLEIYNTVYNITEKNNKLQILIKYEQLDTLELDTGVLPKRIITDSGYKLVDKSKFKKILQFIVLSST